MASKVEGARDYLVSVAERTFGIDAYKRFPEHVRNYDRTHRNDILSRINTRNRVASQVIQFMYLRSWNKHSKKI